MTISPKNKELFEGLEELDHIIQLPQLSNIGQRSLGKIAKVREYLSLMRAAVKLLCKIKPEVCFVLEPNFAPSQTIPWIANVPYRVGYTYKGSKFSWMLTHRTPFRGAYDTNEPAYHVRDANLDVIRCVGVPTGETDSLIRKNVSADAMKFATKFFAQNKLTENDIVVAVQAGTKSIERTWPEERFAAAAKHLVDTYDAKILLIGSPDEIPMNERIKAVIEKNTIIVKDVSLEQVAALLKKSNLALGNDSGLMHMASAVGTTPVVVFGMLIPEHFHPVGPGGHVAVVGEGLYQEQVYAGHDTHVIELMKKISTEQVTSALDKLIIERHHIQEKKDNQMMQIKHVKKDSKVSRKKIKAKKGEKSKSFK